MHRYIIQKKVVANGEPVFRVKLGVDCIALTDHVSGKWFLAAPSTSLDRQTGKKCFGPASIPKFFIKSATPALVASDADGHTLARKLTIQIMRSRATAIQPALNKSQNDSFLELLGAMTDNPLTHNLQEVAHRLAGGFIFEWIMGCCPVSLTALSVYPRNSVLALRPSSWLSTKLGEVLLSVNLSEEIKCCVEQGLAVVNVSPLFHEYKKMANDMNYPTEDLLIFKEARRDLQIPTSNGFYSAKKGEILLGYIPLIHRDESLFKNSHAFNARRFLDNPELKKQVFAFGFVDGLTETSTAPFGCTAASIGMRLFKVVVGTFIQRIDWEFQVEPRLDLSGKRNLSSLITTKTQKTGALQRRVREVANHRLYFWHSDGSGKDTSGFHWQQVAKADHVAIRSSEFCLITNMAHRRMTAASAIQVDPTYQINIKIVKPTLFQLHYEDIISQGYLLKKYPGGAWVRLRGGPSLTGKNTKYQERGLQKDARKRRELSSLNAGLLEWMTSQVEDGDAQ
ncbi:hypothetical protein HDU98_011729 [Podochytrium sp. JEL0797]|nr:hypothetical protein HDU98_011729 [Podochytrium sp. JEL0797]